MEKSDKLSFKQLNQLCDQNLEAKYATECIDIIKNKECLFHPGISLPYDNALSLYELRLRIAKDGNRQDVNYLADFEALIENIRNKKSDYIGITSIYGNDFLYAIFYEPNSQLILGILRGVSSMTDAENLTTEHVASGSTSGKEKYSKGIFMGYWRSQTQF
jgi:hypothetical protein